MFLVCECSIASWDEETISEFIVAKLKSDDAVEATTSEDETAASTTTSDEDAAEDAAESAIEEPLEALDGDEEQAEEAQVSSHENDEL